MQCNERKRLKEIEDRLGRIKHSLDCFLPLHTQLDRKVKGLELERSQLEEERGKLLEGQLELKLDLDF